MDWVCDAVPKIANGRWALVLSRALCRQEGERWEFALPYTPSRPWPLPELVCFARIECIEGREHIIYAFRDGKYPIF